MQIKITGTRLFILAGVLLVAGALESVGFGQNQPTSSPGATQTRQTYLMSIVQVQLPAQGAWEEIVKNEYVPALKKAGVTQFVVWRTATVGKTGEYMIGRPIKSPAELDDPGPIAKALGQDGERALFAKLDRITESVNTFLVTSRPELSIAPAPGYAPKMLHLIATTVAPGRSAEYENVSKGMLAIARKTKLKGLLVGRVGLGGDPDKYLALFLSDSFADGAGFMSAYSKTATDAKLAPVPAGLVVHSERTAYRYVPELSIAPASQKPSK